MTLQEVKEHESRVVFGDRARAFLLSPEWKDLVKPIIDSMIQGATDIRDIKKSMISSGKKAEILIEARAQLAESLEQIEHLIKGFVTDGETSQKMLEKQSKIDQADSLYRTEE